MAPSHFHKVQLVFVLSVITCYSSIEANTHFLPEFEELPPPLVYLVRTDVEQKLTCRAWPFTNTTVNIYYTLRNYDDSSRQMQSTDLALHALPTAWKVHRDSEGIISLPVAGHMLDSLKSKQLHCLASTAFGSLLSRPFQVLEAYLHPFPSQLPGFSSSTSVAENVSVTFLPGNVAYLDCPRPPSQPPASLRFLKDSKNVVEEERTSNNRRNDRYRYIYWPNGNGVSLLISDVTSSDNGDYRCEATNRHTLKKMISPWNYHLDVQMPLKRSQEVRIRRHLYGNQLESTWSVSSDSDGRYKSSESDRVLLLREGQNASLFCVMEAAPPQQITIYPFNINNKPSLSKEKNQRISTEEDFGIYRISQVQLDDAGTYVCSTVAANPSSSSAVVKVIKRLNISNAPVSQSLNNLIGSTVRFTCGVDNKPVSSDASSYISVPSYRVFWYKNGRVITQQNTNEESLIIYEASLGDAGIYQCVVVSKNEWVSRHALLYLKEDEILTKTDFSKKMEMNAREIDKYPPEEDKMFKQNRDRRARDITKPKTITVLFNVVVYIKWDLKTRDKIGMNYFQIEMRQSQKPDSSGALAWSTAVYLPIVTNKTTAYLNETHGLRAGEVYQFRIVMFDTMTKEEISRSQWSTSVSFEHIGLIAPEIVNNEIKENGSLKLQCTYTNQRAFPITHLSILIRPEIIPNESSSLSSSPSRQRRALFGKQASSASSLSDEPKFDKYRNTTVPAVFDTQESQVVELTHVEGGRRYMVAVIGQAWSSSLNKMKYTRLSKDILIVIPPKAVDDRGSKQPGLNTSESHSRMILIVSIACSVTFFIILILLIMCAFHTVMERKQSRQRREEWLMSITEPQGGIGHGSNSATIYKDPAKLLHRENSLLLRYPPPALSPNGSISQHQAATLLNHGSQAHLATINQNNSSSFMLASLNSQQQQQQHLASTNSRFQSLQRMPGHQQHPHGHSGGGGYQMTSTLSMMKREPPSGGDSIHDNMDGSGLNPNHMMSQTNANDRGTLYHRGGVNSLAGSRLMLPHANSPPIVSPMAQAMSLQALNMSAASAGNTANRDSMLLHSTLMPPNSYLTASRQNSAGNNPISPQQQQWLAWQHQQQQQAMAAAMLGYTNPNLVGSWSNNPTTSPDLYYAAAAHALRMQQVNAAAAAGMDGNESVYSYFSQPVQQCGGLDSPSAAFGAQASFFQQQMAMMQQPARPGSVQHPPTLQEQEEEPSMMNNGGMQVGNGETMPSQHSTNTDVNSQAASTAGSISGRPPSSAHHHHHRRRRRKQPSSNNNAASNTNGLQGMTGDNNGLPAQSLNNDPQPPHAGVWSSNNTNSTDHPPPAPPNNNTNMMMNPLMNSQHSVQQEPTATSMGHHGAGGGGGGGGNTGGHNSSNSHYQPKYVNHGSFPPPPISQAGPQQFMASSGVGHHHPFHNSLTRRGTPTLFVEPPRMRDYSEYGIPPNQVASAAPSDMDENAFDEPNTDWCGENESTSGNRLSSSYLPPPPPRA